MEADPVDDLNGIVWEPLCLLCLTCRQQTKGEEKDRLEGAEEYFVCSVIVNAGKRTDAEYDDPNALLPPPPPTTHTYNPTPHPPTRTHTHTSSHWLVGGGGGGGGGNKQADDLVSIWILGF